MEGNLLHDPVGGGQELARRASRRTRAGSRAFRLADRDLGILLALAKMRLLRTGDIAALHFAAKGTAQKRLRKLFDAGLVRAIVTDLAAENRYALTRAGHAVLADALGDAPVPSFRPAPRADRRSVRHLELLNGYRIALAHGAMAAGVELARFVPEWDLRSDDPRAPLVPDAVFTVSFAGGRHAFALEIDTGTESPATVARKVRRYDDASLARRSVAGLMSPAVLIVAATPRRARTLARALLGTPYARPLLGAAPFVLEDGGITRGLASIDQLAAVEAPPTAEHFGHGFRGALGGAAGEEAARTRPFR